jgi:hypothetical protein
MIESNPAAGVGVTAHPEVGQVSDSLSTRSVDFSAARLRPGVLRYPVEGSGGRVEDGAVQGRPGDSKAGGYFGNRDVGSFEQRSDGLAESLAGRPPLRPRARAAFRPATVRSRIRFRSNSEFCGELQKADDAERAIMQSHSAEVAI